MCDTDCWLSDKNFFFMCKNPNPNNFYRGICGLISQIFSNKVKFYYLIVKMLLYKRTNLKINNVKKLKRQFF